MLNRGLDKQELLRIVDSVANEKSIDKELILNSMETAIQRAAYSKFGFENAIEATINREDGTIKIQKVLEIVENVEDPVRQITLQQAGNLDKKNKNLKVGDKIYEELPQIDFGRIAAQSAKQVISQKVREAEKNRQYEDFKDKKVAVIGTGSSAIQSSPIIAADAQTVTIFQRTPNYSIPARNAALDPSYVDDIKARYSSYRDENWQRGFGADFRDNEQSALSVSNEERLAEYEDRWARGGLAFLAAYSDLVFDDEANSTARDFFGEKIASRVEDPELAQKLIPDFPIGCKRLCVDTDYYEIYNEEHVTLVDLKEQPIREVTETGIRTSVGDFEADIIVLATGFDAMTGAVTRIDIKGRQGRTLEDKWAEGPRAFLGLATEGFPNMFLVTGPGSPSVLSNMLPSIEQHVEWISDCIEYLNENHLSTIDVSIDAENEWVRHVNEVGNTSVYPRCNSWYLGANVEGKKRVFMPYLGVPPYVEKCKEVVAAGYEGFVLSA